MMNIRQSNKLMKSQLRALFLGLTFSLASVGVSHAMSELLSISEEPVWPVSSNPDGSIVYNITTAGRGGSGLLEVTLSAGDMPPGVTVVFSPSVLRFTGNQATNQTATMTVYSTGLIPLDCFPFTITGTAQRETITVTNQVLYSASAVATRPPTLMLDSQSNSARRLRGLGSTGKTYQIEAKSSLSNPVWTPLGSATADANGRFVFFPSPDPGSPVRFFRAVTPVSPPPAQ
jgi:hypothetical protein